VRGDCSATVMAENLDFEVPGIGGCRREGDSTGTVEVLG